MASSPAPGLNQTLRGPGNAARWTLWVILAGALVPCGHLDPVALCGVVAVGALVFIWLERKVAGRIQDRLGPTPGGGKFKKQIVDFSWPKLDCKLGSAIACKLNEA